MTLYTVLLLPRCAARSPLRWSVVLLALLLNLSRLAAEAVGPVPPDFPTFRVPGFEAEMVLLRQWFWQHYLDAGPKSTLWDEWLSAPSLWPATFIDGTSEGFRRQWRQTLSRRFIDPDGYVATHQHASIAHPLGWPFPSWNQGSNGFGWHFSFKDTVGPPWRPEKLSTTNGWVLGGASDLGITEEGWKMNLDAKDAVLTLPIASLDLAQAPFVQVRWAWADVRGDARPYLEWHVRGLKNEPLEQRVYFESPVLAPFASVSVPLFRHPRWKGQVDQLRLGVGNRSAGGQVILQAVFSQYDTRHNVNAQSFIRGCANYFNWTGNLDFLRENVNRMRTALRYLMTEHETLTRKLVVTRWVGHDGRSGLSRTKEGAKRIHSGRGIGNNYWDLLPFGNLDAYATLRYYDTLRAMSQLEREIRSHPDWGVPLGFLAFDPAVLDRHANEVKIEGNREFWNPLTGRFAACVDVEGHKHDYGFTFVNLEAIHYGFASPDRAASIMSWICGERAVEGDTSRGQDIYYWRFGPRATTLRNVDWYCWAWNSPESIPWGGQVQDGGAVLGFSYHDLMARLRTRGADNAWNRLREVLQWFSQVRAAGGYRKYYDGSRAGSLQGGGTAGGLGMDQEFFESVLVPQVMLDGFLGFTPTGDGFRLDPLMPREWPELSVDRIRLKDHVLRVRVNREFLEIWTEGEEPSTLFAIIPQASEQASLLRRNGEVTSGVQLDRRKSDGAFRLDWKNTTAIRIIPKR